jgi:hypothetical protein
VNKSASLNSVSDGSHLSNSYAPKLTVFKKKKRSLAGQAGSGHENLFVESSS